MTQMRFIRPEVAHHLTRWRETLAGTAAFALGGYWMFAGNGALTIIGTVLTVGGALLAAAGIQRARFRRGAGGAGVVQVNEGQLAYFGPLDGGVLAVTEITRLDLDPGTPPEPARWILWHRGGEPLTIPVNATNAELLFDIFSDLDGLRTETVLSRLHRLPVEPVTLWQTDLTRLH